MAGYGGLESRYRSRSARARCPSGESRSYIVLPQTGHSGEGNEKATRMPRGMSRKEPPIIQRKAVLKLSRDNNPSGRITRPTRNTAIQTIGAMQPPINAPIMAVPARLRPVAWTGFPSVPHWTLEQINRITNYRVYKGNGLWRCRLASFAMPLVQLAQPAQFIVSSPPAIDNESGGLRQDDHKVRQIALCRSS